MVREEQIIALFNSRLKYVNGELIWLNGKNKDKIAGTITKNKYRQISINNKRYYAHTITFAIHYNYIPKLIDHKDRNKLNNNINNLREATVLLNTINRGLDKTNTSGVKGVTLFKRTGKYTAQIKIKGKKIHLGYFNSLEEAKIVRINAEKQYWNDI